MYDHYIGLDWSISNMAISRRTKSGKEVYNEEHPTDLKLFKEYIKTLKGKVILTFEETTGAQWLWVELVGLVKDLIVCDPYRNSLLSEGAKNDKIDASKLSHLLYAGMLRSVFHSKSEFIYLRKLVSSYIDIRRDGVRNKNRKNAFYRSNNGNLSKDIDQFINAVYEENLELYEQQMKEYKVEFEHISKKYKPMRDLQSIPGIGVIHAAFVLATVVDVKRFKTPGKFLSYSGLISHEKISGGKSYGRRKARYSRVLKHVFDTAALSVIKSKDSGLKDYHNFLIENKRYADHNAKRALSRKIARITFAVLNKGKRYSDKMIRK